MGMATTTEKIIRIELEELRIKAYCPNCQKEWWVTKDQKFCPLCDEWLVKVVTTKNISLEEAKKKILKYLETREDVVYTDEIAEALNLDFDLTHKALMELWKDGEVIRE